MRKIFGVLELAILLLGALVTAYATGTQQQAGPESNELRIAIDSWLLSKWPTQEAADKFMAEHPGVKVTIAPNAKDYGNNWLLPWSQGNTDCDLMIGGQDTTISPFVAKGLLEPLDDVLVNDGTIDLRPQAFVKAVLESCKFGTHYYGIPFQAAGYYMIVNVDMMRTAGLVGADGKPIPPKDFDEWYQYAKKMTQKDANGKVTVWGQHINWGANSAAVTYMALLQSQKGTYWDRARKNMDFTSPEALKVLTFAKKLVDDGYASPETVSDENADRNDLKAGKAAMILTYHGRFKEGQVALGGKDKCTVMAWPGADQNGGNTISILCVIPKLSKAKSLAKLFIREQMMSTYGQQWSANKFGKMPSLIRNFEGLEDPEYQLVLKSLNKSGFGPKLVMFNELDKLIQVETQNMILGKQSPEETLKRLKEKSAQLDLTMVGK